MASSGGWLVFSFMLVLVVVEFRSSSSARCERGLGNCDELAFSRDKEKRAGCFRHSCLGKKRESDESLEELLENPENEKQTVDEIIDEIFQKRLSEKRDENKGKSPPGCQRSGCLGKKRSAMKDVVPHDSGSTDETGSKRKASPLSSCWRFGRCKRTIEKDSISSPTISKKEPETKQDEDSKSDCFRFGCKKRGDENYGMTVTQNNKARQKGFALDQDDMSVSRCWRFGCKRSAHLQKMHNEIVDVKRLNKKPNNQMR